MRSWLATLVAAVLCAGVVGQWGAPAAAAAIPSWSSIASRGTQELIGSGDGSPAAWNRAAGMWSGQWWQSAVGIATISRYGERTGQLRKAIQKVLTRTYRAHVSNSTTPNFTDQFMDDTAWWGLGWLAAAHYELSAGDQADAGRFLSVAEADAFYIAVQPRACGGVPWIKGGVPHTISQATFIALTAELARFRQAVGPFHDSVRSAAWLGLAQAGWAWLQQSGLINETGGAVVYDGFADGSCQQFEGGPVTYTQGEVADAQVQLGSALGDSAYDTAAAGFLQYAINPTSPFVFGGILQDRCEAISTNCAANSLQGDITSFKGIFIQDMSDWATATGSTQFDQFLQAQPAAILSNDVFRVKRRTAPCHSPPACQFGMSWSRRVSPVVVTAGTQESALSALTAVLPAAAAPPPAETGGAPAQPAG